MADLQNTPGGDVPAAAGTAFSPAAGITHLMDAVLVLHFEKTGG